MWPLYLALLFYSGMYLGGVPTHPLNMLSFFHASMTVTMYYVFQMEFAVLCNSIAYFTVDTWIAWGTFWVPHHGLALLGLIPALLYPDLRDICLTIFGVVEVGGLLYHVSRWVPKSKICRLIFLVTYGFSRMLATSIYLSKVVSVFADIHRSWFHHWCAVTLVTVITILIPFNWWFFYKQILNYNREFS